MRFFIKNYKILNQSNLYNLKINNIISYLVIYIYDIYKYSN
jgi:hypothetical protein